MNKIFTFFLVVLSSTAFSQIPTFGWAFKTGGTGTDVGLAIKHDQQNNVYAGGRFEGSIDIDPGTVVQTITSAGGFDMYIQKLDENNNLLWSYNTGSTLSEEIVDLAIDASGNVYFTCFYGGTVDFDPSTSVSALTSLANSNMAIVKLDAAGNFLWVKTIGTTVDCGTPYLAIDANSNCYISFGFLGSIDANPGAATELLTSAGQNDVVIVKLNSSGDYLWSRQLGSDSFDATLGISVNSLGNVVVAGRFRSTVDFNPGAGVNNSTGNGENDLFLLTLTSSGDYVWHKAYGGADFDSYYDLCIDDQNNILVTGYFSGTADLNPGAATDNFTSIGTDDLFVQKFDVNGNMIWTRVFGGTDIENSYGISTDSQGAIYIVGDFFDTIDFDPTDEVFNMTSAGNNDIFVQKLTANGDFAWAFRIGAPFTQAGYDIDVDENNNVLITGTLSSNVDFNPGPGSSILFAGSTFDAFVGKYIQTLCVQPVLTNLNSSSNNICEGEELVLTVEGNLNGAAEWKLYSGTQCNGVVLETNTSGVFTRNAISSETDYFVKAAGGCLAQESNCIEKVLIIKPSYNQTQNISICSGEDIIMPDGSTLSNVTQSGQSTFTLQSSSSCDSTINVLYEVNLVPMDFTFDNNLVTVTVNPKIGADISWLDCTNGFSPIDGETSTTYQLVAPVSVAFQVTTSEGCSAISECFTLLNIENLEDNFEIYPNPFNEVLNIKMESQISQISIFSMTGSLVYTNATFNNQTIIDTKLLSPGAYILRVVTNGKPLYTNIIKTK